MKFSTKTGLFKKLGVLLLAMMFILSAVSCAANEKSSDASESTDAENGELVYPSKKAADEKRAEQIEYINGLSMPVFYVGTDPDEDENDVIYSGLRSVFNNFANNYVFHYMPDIEWYDFGEKDEYYGANGEDTTALNFICRMLRNDDFPYLEVGGYNMYAWDALNIFTKNMYASKDGNAPDIEKRSFTKIADYHSEIDMYSNYPEDYIMGGVSYCLTEIQSRTEGGYIYYKIKANVYNIDPFTFYELTENERKLFIDYGEYLKGGGSDPVDFFLNELIETGDILKYTADSEIEAELQTSVEEENRMTKIVSFKEINPQQ